MTKNEAKKAARELFETRFREAGLEMTKEMEVVEGILFTMANNISALILELQQENEMMAATISQLAMAIVALKKGGLEMAATISQLATAIGGLKEADVN